MKLLNWFKRKNLSDLVGTSDVDSMEESSINNDSDSLVSVETTLVDGEKMLNELKQDILSNKKQILKSIDQNTAKPDDGWTDEETPLKYEDDESYDEAIF